ncbi:MAG: AMP-binding protein [Propionibacteriales bacterium]|nr:AMP-binding protein [Propionibacteriales bacterium]
MTTLWELLPEQARRHRDRPALCGPTGAITYGRLAHEAAGCAAQLRALGVKPRDHVALLAPNSLAWVAGFFGIVSVGGVVDCLSPDATVHELEGMVDVSRPVAAVSAPAVERAQVLDDRLPGRTVWADDLEEPGWRTGASLQIPDCEADAPAVVAFTAGSTGRPKGALHRADTLVRCGEDYLEHVLDGAPRRLPANLPLYHMGGIVLVLLPALMGAGSITLLRGFNALEVAEALARDRVDAMLAIPAMMELLFMKVDLDAYDLSSLEVVAMGGAPVPNSLVRQVAERLSVRVHVGYGSTECPGFFLVTRRDTPLDGIGPFVGRPTGEEYEVAILDDEGRPVAAGEIGEICIRSPYVMTAYLGNPEATAQAMSPDGWLHSGDLGRLRADGGVVIDGRKKEMYIRGGFNVYPAEVEARLLEHPDVVAAAVHAIADPVLGEKGWAWVVAEAGSTLGPGGLRTFVGDRLSHHKVPDHIEVVDALPLNSIGKIDKVALRTRAQESKAG